MSAAQHGAGAAAAAPRSAPDRLAFALLAAGLAALVLPTLWDLSYGVWAESGHGQEPLIVALSGWLVWRRRQALAALPRPASRRGAVALLAFGLLLYLVGRTQQVLRFETGALLFVATAVVCYTKGWRGVRTVWFALFFLLFAMPLPNEWVVTLTQPLKAAVSAAAVKLLSWAGYPVGRAGVVMTVGQYQLLVTEACAGLQTLFTLEAVGLLYANLMAYRSPLRNGLLALLVVPVSFFANVVRVVVLSLVTYHLGDAAGQGFIHGFAGLVLFAVALALLVGIDALLGRALPVRHRA